MVYICISLQIKWLKITYNSKISLNGSPFLAFMEKSKLFPETPIVGMHVTLARKCVHNCAHYFSQFQEKIDARKNEQMNVKF